jgi:putative spermidine/putrescine transport system ATP-binding protein
MIEASSIALSLQGISKNFGSAQILRDINLDVRSGEFVSILGPSGVGKTTVLKIIAGLLAPSSGTVYLSGEDVGLVPPEKRNIGMVFQSYALFPHLTVFENVAFPLRERGYAKPAMTTKVAEALGLVALSKLSHSYPKRLSGGQQQRVALARALVFDPRIVLMDEPLSALDRQLRVEMQGEMKRICAARQATVLYVTHDQSEALVLSDRIAVINEGKIEQYDLPVNIYDRPASAPSFQKRIVVGKCQADQNSIYVRHT